MCNRQLKQQRFWITQSLSVEFGLLISIVSGIPNSLRWITDRAIFVWPWNENAQTKQKQQTNRNRAIWLVYQTDTNARGFWLVKRTLGWKNFMPENFLEINRYFALTSYCNTTGQLNDAFSTWGFSLAGKRGVHVLIFSSWTWTWTLFLFKHGKSIR